MPETPEEREKIGLRELEGKNVAQYSVLLNAWIDTKMQRDKTLVTLSAGGLGLLVTLATTVGIKHVLEWLLYPFSFLGFLATIWLCLRIYE